LVTKKTALLKKLISWINTVIKRLLRTIPVFSIRVTRMTFLKPLNIRATALKRRKIRSRPKLTWMKFKRAGSHNSPVDRPRQGRITGAARCPLNRLMDMGMLTMKTRDMEIRAGP
jgi:hypothetical protein